MYVSETILNALRNYCAYQDRCHSEVRTKLLSLQCYGDELEEIIGILIEEKFLDEERYARSYVRGKFNSLKWGKNKILQQLKFKQISDYCIRKGMEEIDPEDYYQVMLQLAQKKWDSLHSEKNEWARSQKVVRYLVTKGFEMNLSIEIINDIDKA